MAGKILRPGDPRDILAARFEIEKTDVFHLKNIYEFMHHWLDEHQWEDTDVIGGDKFEHLYWEKRLQNGTREHRIWWRLHKFEVPSDYFRFVLVINFRNLKAKKVEVVQQGQKVSTWNTNLTLLIEAWLQLDYKNMWRNHFLLKHVDKLYRERIWHSQMERWKKYLWREAYEFGGMIKKYLDMKHPHEQPSPFHPVMGTGPNPTPRK